MPRSILSMYSADSPAIDSHEPSWESSRAARSDGSAFTFASPRASIHLTQGARALGFLRGRDYALPQDAVDLVPDVLRHRVVLSFAALSDAQTPDQIVRAIIKSPLPYDQLIREFDRWTHVAIPMVGSPARKSKLIIDKAGTRPFA